MKYLLILAVILGLFGCAISSPVHLADGSEGYKISCNGSASSFGVCLEKAGEICGTRGYTLFDKDGSSASFGTANVSQYGGTAQYGAMVSRYIMLKCNAPK